ncbi:hypothetical protein [Enterococcus saccharolyticus]|uniref:hypothetical protein n=1 Tax=Enterococcus saccharolyticus TaxID=41997 RepID=UPI0039DF6FF5
MSFKITGLDKLQKELSNMSKAAEELNGTHEVPLYELFTDNFISENSKFSTAEEFFSTDDIDFDNQEAFEALPDEVIDKYISENTDFDTWSDMLTSAGKQYALKKLGF